MNAIKGDVPMPGRPSISEGFGLRQILTRRI
jgi:hypothetical protein